MQPTNDREEDMRILSSGDVHVSHQSPIAHQPQSSGLGKAVAGAVIGASLLGIPGAGVAGYLVSQMNQQKTEPASVPSVINDGETVELGLKKLEDLEL